MIVRPSRSTRTDPHVPYTPLFRCGGASAFVGEGHPGAVAPHAGEDVEVRGPVALAIGVAPEADRHRWQRRGDHQLAGGACRNGSDLRIERLDRAAEQGAADLAGPHGPRWRGAHERGAPAGPAADGAHRTARKSVV